MRLEYKDNDESLLGFRKNHNRNYVNPVFSKDVIRRITTLYMDKGNRVKSKLTLMGMDSMFLNSKSCDNQKKLALKRIIVGTNSPSQDSFIKEFYEKMYNDKRYFDELINTGRLKSIRFITIFKDVFAPMLAGEYSYINPYELIFDRELDISLGVNDLDVFYPTLDDILNSIEPNSTQDYYRQHKVFPTKNRYLIKLLDDKYAEELKKDLELFKSGKKVKHFNEILKIRNSVGLDDKAVDKYIELKFKEYARKELKYMSYFKTDTDLMGRGYWNKPADECVLQTREVAYEFLSDTSAENKARLIQELKWFAYCVDLDKNYKKNLSWISKLLLRRVSAIVRKLAGDTKAHKHTYKLYTKFVLKPEVFDKFKSSLIMIALGEILMEAGYVGNSKYKALFKSYTLELKNHIAVFSDKEHEVSQYLIKNYGIEIEYMRSLLFS